MNLLPKNKLLRILTESRHSLLDVDLEAIVEPGAATKVSTILPDEENALQDLLGNLEVLEKLCPFPSLDIDNSKMDLNMICSEEISMMAADDMHVQPDMSPEGKNDAVMEDLVHGSSSNATDAPQNSSNGSERYPDSAADPSANTLLSRVELLEVQLRNSSDHLRESEANAVAAWVRVEEMESHLQNMEAALQNSQIQVADQVKMMTSHWEMLGALESRLRALEPLEARLQDLEARSADACKEKRQKISHQGSSPSGRSSKAQLQMENVLISIEKITVERLVKVLWDHGMISREQLNNPVLKPLIGPCSWLDLPSPDDRFPSL